MKRCMVVLFFLAACAKDPGNPSDLKDFKDIKRAEKRSDGLYNVVCMDGRIEIGVSLEQITGDQVCREPKDPPAISCNAPVVSAYEMRVTRDASGRYQIGFAQEKDAHVNVVNLYVTGMNDALPVFPDFKFTGTAYWMVSVDDPFELFFNLPVSYGNLPNYATDMTRPYGGYPGGILLDQVSVPTCIKFSAISFDFDSGFQTSSYVMLHRPL